MVEEVLNNRGGVELAGAADGGVPRQVLIDFVAQEIQAVESQIAVRNEAAVTGDVFQAAHQHELEEDYPTCSESAIGAGRRAPA